MFNHSFNRTCNPRAPLHHPRVRVPALTPALTDGGRVRALPAPVLLPPRVRDGRHGALVVRLLRVGIHEAAATVPLLLLLPPRLCDGRRGAFVLLLLRVRGWASGGHPGLNLTVLQLPRLLLVPHLLCR